MKQKKIDYKIKKNSPPLITKKSKKKVEGNESTGGKGLFIIFFAFLALTAVSYYLLRDIKTVPEPIIDKVYKDLPIYSHLIVLNESENQLSSVVLITFHRDKQKLVLTYFPSEITMSNNKTLHDEYKSNGVKGVLFQFQKYFQDFFKGTFHYILVKKMFYTKISSQLRNVNLYKEGDKRLIVNENWLDNGSSQNFYSVHGENLIKYLKLNERSRTLSSISSKRIRLLYTVISFLSNKNDLSGVLNADSKRDSYFKMSSFSDKEREGFLKVLKFLRLENIYTYPLSIRQHKKSFTLSSSAREYFQFLQTPARQPKIGKKMRVKIIDQSGGGNRIENIDRTFKSYFHNVLNLKIVNYEYKGSDVINKSYLININHNLEVLNYAKGVLRIGTFYHSAHQGSKYYDLILVMGKDFPKISSKGN